MGNCAVTQHAVTSWADDGEWDVPSAAAAEEEAAAGTSGRNNKDHAHAAAAAEVTIRITRKQLQELMEKRAGGLRRRGLKSRRAAAQLLADVMNAGQVYHHHCRAAHWKPALQSIPEAVES